ncbi:hypothetical protein [uncultured Sphingobium sp.]|uniref:hypothetical protein n=1 Tax=uncultured Sphingobium sp. TaxID=316087 RepID=UPI0032B1EFB2|tara:strand:+ start:377 stop:1411 length:1035 start_codon:yes stop_codon:yes gene_type:complete
MPKPALNASCRHPGSPSRLSADFAGRSIDISPEVPALFDAPLSPHHRVIGRWVAGREENTRRFARDEARHHIETVFNDAVLDILKPFKLVDFRVAALTGDESHPPAIALICDSVGQLDLGWIEKSNVLRTTTLETVAPVRWQATAYAEIVDKLGIALPVFGYSDLFDEVSLYYWEGSTDDEDAKRFLIDMHGADPDDLGDYTLPSTMNARRPHWMLPENVSALKYLPKGLATKIREVRRSFDALKNAPVEASAWRFDFDEIREYLPHLEDAATLPPLTIVPFDLFARELDEVCRSGMEYGFMDVAGLCPLTDAATIDAWLASLKLGLEFLLRVQDLIDLNPKDM